MDFNTLITDHTQGEFPIIEDVLIDPSYDGTSSHVTLCGRYGQELSTMTIADAELDALQTTLSDCNFIQD